MRRLPDPTQLLAVYVRPRLAFLIDAPRSTLFKAAFVVGLSALVGLSFSTGFGLFLATAEMRCMPERLYVGFPRNEVLRKGDLVSYRANSKMMLGLMTGSRVGKMVVGVPGDRVVSNSKGVRINGVLVGVRNPISMGNLAKLGKEPVDVDKVLAPGELFVMGTLPRSFDSRYWGVLKDEAVDRQLKGLL